MGKHMYITYLTPLIKLQKMAVCVIVGANKKALSDGIYKMLKIVPLVKLHIFNVHKFLYKLYHGNLPDIITKMFSFNREKHHHVTRLSTKFHVEQVNCDVRRLALRHQATILYNNGDDTDYDASFVMFKAIVKDVLIFS